VKSGDKRLSPNATEWGIGVGMGYRLMEKGRVPKVPIREPRGVRVGKRLTVRKDR